MLLVLVDPGGLLDQLRGGEVLAAGREEVLVGSADVGRGELADLAVGVDGFCEPVPVHGEFEQRLFVAGPQGQHHLVDAVDLVEDQQYRLLLALAGRGPDGEPVTCALLRDHVALLLISS
ncbi:hypothetical protein [Streptomyces sp. NPDC051001]|uniref:hypothetical protein n=1 Tax=Streptomyces sp. NPDC051001 TaxID=3155795 RepID=UPI00342ACA56